jgi:hypothetical protein
MPCQTTPYLQACVHLEEVKVLVLVYKKLDGTGGLVLDSLGELHCLLAHLRMDFAADCHARSLFNHFLVAPLNGALSLQSRETIAASTKCRPCASG